MLQTNNGTAKYQGYTGGAHGKVDPRLVEGKCEFAPSRWPVSPNTRASTRRHRESPDTGHAGPDDKNFTQQVNISDRRRSPLGLLLGRVSADTAHRLGISDIYNTT